MLRRLRQVLQENNGFNSQCDKIEQSSSSASSSNQPPIKLRNSTYKRENDGSVTLSVTLDKDQVECCVCFSSMTGMIYRCRAQGTVCHNICASCEWQIRRMKNVNGHTKAPSCPMCKAEGQFIRNRPLEKQLYEISVPCKNQEHGCEMRHFQWDENSQQVHLKKCVFGPITCPFCYQSIPGGRMNFVEHLRSSLKSNNDNNESESKNASTDNENCNNEIDDIIHSHSHSHNERISSRSNNLIINNNQTTQFTQQMPFIQTQTSRQSNNLIQNHPYTTTTITTTNTIPIPTHTPLPNINDEEKFDIDNDSDNQNLNNEHIHSRSKIVGCLLEFKETKLTVDIQKYATFTLNRENTFVVNYAYGYVSIFLKPDEICPCWKVYCISIAPHHVIAGNNRVYLQYQSQEEFLKYLQIEQQQGLSGDALLRPVSNTLQLTMGRLAPEFFYQKKKIIQMEENHNHSIFARSIHDRNSRSQTLSINGNSIIEQKWDETDDGFFASRCNTPTASTSTSTSTSTSVSTNTCITSTVTTNTNTSNIITVNNNRRNAICQGIDNHFNDKIIKHDNHILRESNNESDELDLHDLNPNSFIAKSPCTYLQVGYIYAGLENMPYSFKSMHIRLFTLEESIKVGTIIDARDFTGKWYQAEILKVADNCLQESSLLQDHDPLIMRRFKIHYLGYSANYDEWLNIDTDSHRIAQRGIYTVGPDLRAARRYTGRQMQVQVNQSVLPRILVENVAVGNELPNDNNDEMNA